MVEKRKSNYQILVRRTAEKNLYKIQFFWREKIERAIDILERDPFYGEKMKGKLKERRKIKIWPYRIIYRVLEKEKIIFIESVRHRGSAYKGEM